MYSKRGGTSNNTKYEWWTAIAGETAIPGGLDALEPLIGHWHMTPSFAPDADDAPHATTTFEWLAGSRSLIQRWEVDHPDAPDGIAIIGLDPVKDIYVQHYFDSRGVERVYEMSLSAGAWTLQRIAEPPDFSPRFRGSLSDGGDSIIGSWESSTDQGASWSSDFDLTYTRAG
jgi:hypothetical protein